MLADINTAHHWHIKVCILYDFISSLLLQLFKAQSDIPTQLMHMQHMQHTLHKDKDPTYINRIFVCLEKAGTGIGDSGKIY